MKKIMGMMLGLALIAGTATFTMAQDKDKKPAPKKAPAMMCKDAKGKMSKTKAGKCPEGSEMVPAAPAKAAPKKDK